MNDESNWQEIRQAYKLVCLKCGSEDVVVDVTESGDWGGETGYSLGSLSIGCNACKQNDLYLNI